MCIPPDTSTTLAPGSEISEAILAAVWNEQAPLRGPMWDCGGRPVAVVYRGRWTAGSGPDFEGAMLSLDGTLVSGSVEMHLRCADWWSHGHHEDPRYNSVTLHVVLWPVGARPVVRADGTTVPTLVLADYIALPAGELLETLSPLVGNLGALSEEPCWQRTQHTPLDRLLEHIDAAGDARLLSKAAAMEASLEVLGDPDEVFYRGLMDALGYSANREPMRELAGALPVSQLLALPLTRDENERAALLESILLGAAGLLPSQRPDIEPLNWASQEYSDQAEETWRAYATLVGLHPDVPAVGGWNTERVRPANSPPRRLAAAARLLARLLWQPGGMLGPFLRSAHEPPARLSRTWTDLLTVPGSGYWGSHSDFGRAFSGEGSGTSKTTEEVALVGKSRAADVTVNILLPMLVALGDSRNEPALHEAALNVYAHYPALSDNRITRAMADEALGPRKKSTRLGARRQQGLIHLYRLYCEARRCYECPVSGLSRQL